MWLAYVYFPPLPPMPTVTERLVFTLQCHILTVGAVFNAFNVSILTASHVFIRSILLCSSPLLLSSVP